MAITAGAPHDRLPRRARAVTIGGGCLDRPGCPS
jgi:hypothetical protein